MKNNLRLFLLLGVMVVAFSSCDKNNPKDVAKRWLIGFNQMDFEDAMTVSTNDTKNLLSSLQELTEAVSDSAKTELKKIEVTINDAKVTGDTAVVTYITTDNPLQQELVLVKQDNKWVVLFTKADLVGEMPEPIEPEEEPMTDMPTDSTATTPEE